ncbi:hypothetical protein [Streptomyces shaanxiensis]
MRERGALHLADGKVVHAESPAAPGAHVLLAAHGTLDADAWARALAESAAHAEGPAPPGPGPVAPARRWCTTRAAGGGRAAHPGALELCRLTALYDAAYFALAPSSAPGRFRYGTEDDPDTPGTGTPAHPAPDTSDSPGRSDSPSALASPAPPLLPARSTPPAHGRAPPSPARPIPVADLERETLRRRDLLHRIWRDALVDEAPLTREYRPRPPRSRPGRLALVRDGVHTASDIARELGRPVPPWCGHQAARWPEPARQRPLTPATPCRAPSRVSPGPQAGPMPGLMGVRGPARRRDSRPAPVDLTGATAPVDSPHHAAEGSGMRWRPFERQRIRARGDLIGGGARTGVLEELRRLRPRVPQLTGALAADTDGSRPRPGVRDRGRFGSPRRHPGRWPPAWPTRPAKATCANCWCGWSGYVATYAAGAGAVVALLAQDHVNVGRPPSGGPRAGAGWASSSTACPKR